MIRGILRVVVQGGDAEEACVYARTMFHLFTTSLCELLPQRAEHGLDAIDVATRNKNEWLGTAESDLAASSSPTFPT